MTALSLFISLYWLVIDLAAGIVTPADWSCFFVVC